MPRRPPRRRRLQPQRTPKPRPKPALLPNPSMKLHAPAAPAGGRGRRQASWGIEDGRRLGPAESFIGAAAAPMKPSAWSLGRRSHRERPADLARMRSRGSPRGSVTPFAGGLAEAAVEPGGQKGLQPCGDAAVVLEPAVEMARPSLSARPGQPFGALAASTCTSCGT